MSDASNQQDGPIELPDAEATARFNLQSIINFLELSMGEHADLSPGAEESLSWATSSACDAARRIFTAMSREGADA